jgi:cytochrome oxidase Cu insertion factor (SCO1/SenC/PrrC family)
VKTRNGRQRIFLWPGLLVLAVCVHGLQARAGAYPGPVPDVHVWDEANQDVSLRSVLGTAGAGPVILLPVYTRCSASCPVLTQKLEEETVRMGSIGAYRVLLFSFDPSETADSLRMFREQLRVPAHWILVRADEVEILRFLGFFHYPVMTEGSLLIHPNELFLLDHNLNWRATLVGADWSSAELHKNLSWIQNPGLVEWIAMNPPELALIGFGGLLLSLALIMGWLIFCRPRRRSLPT